jgi:hypothetical protein
MLIESRGKIYSISQDHHALREAAGHLTTEKLIPNCSRPYSIISADPEDSSTVACVATKFLNALSGAPADGRWTASGFHTFYGLRFALSQTGLAKFPPLFTICPNSRMKHDLDISPGEPESELNILCRTNIQNREPFSDVKSVSSRWPHHFSEQF